MSKKSGAAVNKAGAKRGAELTFLNCKDWIGFGFAALILSFFILLLLGYDTVEDTKVGCIIAITVTALVLVALACLQALLNGVRPHARSLQALWKSVSPFQKLLALYLLLCIVSYFASPYRGQADLWVGTSRDDGLRTQLLYGAIALIAANCIKKRMHWLLLIFAGTITLLSVIGLLQAYGAGFWIFTSDVASQSFYTTIGNQNFVSAMLCMGIAAIGTAFVVWDDRLRPWLAAPLFLAAWFLLLIENDSGIVGVGVYLMVLPILCWNTPERISRGLIAYSTIALAFALWQTLPFSGGPGTAPLPTFDKAALLGLAAAATLVLLGICIGKLSARIRLSKKAWTIIWGALVVVLLITAAVLFMRLELTPDAGFLYQFQEMLRGNFDDSFGSYRIYAWKRTIALLPHTPAFGFGPDCFYVVFNEANWYESIQGLQMVFDFAHNEYLQIAINYGIIGLTAYLATMFTLAVRAIRRKERNVFILIFGTAAMIYCCQAFFSFAHLIMTPVFWLMLGLTEAGALAVDRGLEIES